MTLFGPQQIDNSKKPDDQMSRLTLIKLIHTLVWLFFNVVISYLFYAVVTGKIDKWVWICLGLIAFETVILVMFKMMCPLTVMARKYSDSAKDNFDIYLPEWLARYNKRIYSIIVGVILIILFFRLILK
jgi:hypothetical protein